MEGLMMLESHFAKGGSDQQLQQMQAKKSALESSTGILELALAEFPGCALLHFYYLETLADYVYQCECLHKLSAQGGDISMEASDRVATLDRLNTGFEMAWQAVGRGTHVNEGMIVSEIYRLHGSFLLFRLSSLPAGLKVGVVNDVGTKNEFETNAILQALSTLFQKWSKTPMGEGSNDEMMQDLEYIWEEACQLLLSLCDGNQQKLKRKQDLDEQKVTLWANIDGERKKASSLMNILASHENEVDVAMSNEGIALPRSSLFPPQDGSMVESSIDCDLGRYAQPLKRTGSKWNQLLLGDKARFLLGLGGTETSRAFLRSTSFLQRTYQDMAKKGVGHSPVQDQLATYKHSLISSMYERAISECPTVELLWVSYMNFLRGEWIRLQNERKKAQLQQQQEPHYQQQQKELSGSLRSTSYRATKNCPYSSTLFEIRMTTLGVTTMSNLEPDHISGVVKEATQLGFLNDNGEAMLHLRLVSILVVKRRLLSLVSLGTTATPNNGPGKDYDHGEELSVSNRKKLANGVVIYQTSNPAVMEEVQDLLEDIRDMYDEADTFLFKSHPTWSEGKVLFWKHRALTEAYVLCPISLALRESSHCDDGMDEEIEAPEDKEAIRCFEKLVKAQKPSHPDSWREYITYVRVSHLHLRHKSSNSTKSQPDSIAAVVSTLRKTRGLYHRAMSSMKKAGQEVRTAENTQLWMGKGIDSAMVHRNYNSALSDLCREYLEFERTAGSEESLSHALTLVRSKLANWNTPLVPSLALATPAADNKEESHGKRKLEAHNITSLTESGPSVVTKGDSTQSKTKKAKVKTNLKLPKKTDAVHKVRIGKIDYPAHPYTIHVSKLSKDTQDMDLVDAFRPEFGGIVHAKIMREKCTGVRGHHYHGDSKCSGLIQFEEQMSVEQALQKDGEFKLEGKIIKIQRSHIPAVGLVPSGMHRVNPKGEGKISKRNKLKKTSKMKVDTNQNMDIEEQKKSDKHVEATDHQKKEKKSIPSSSPSSISLGVLSFKPRGMKQKPKISLETTKRQG